MLSILIVTVISVLFYRTLAQRRRISQFVAHIPGPPSPSFVLGHFSKYYIGEVGEHEFAWQERYGPVYRIKALFGEDRLVIADPKALQYCLQNADSNWPKPVIRRELGRFFLGRGIAWAQGDDHKRHRKVMTPAFGNIETRGMMPVFRKIADRMCRHWRDIIDQGIDSKSARIEVADWLSRATLDAVGEAAFQYEFGSLENRDNELARSYNSLLVDAFSAPSKGKIFAQQILGYAPIGFFRFIEKLPSSSLKRLRETAQEGDKVARQLVDEKLRSLRVGLPQSRRDVMDILVQANLSEKSSTRLSDEELYAQLRTVIAAGHETTGNQISFTLYELARHPNVQDKLRKEIHAMLRSVNARGNTEYEMSDLDGMQYTLAVLKEVLRLHPVVYGPFVYAEKDDILPLQTPIKTKDGRLISEIPVAAGQYVHMSFAGYNRLRSVWGLDAHEFRPERWLDESSTRQESHFGVYSNLGNFASGNVSCLGWRFAVIEIQTFMVEIFSQFQASYPEDGKKVLRATSGVMAPVLEGEPGRKQLPLDIVLVN
ncbi:hypothetical protein CERSUDRAFT_115012 [Gelatoporia subvermispora B]|uniref:Cytochrome P450 n=1 Tax=Ceriporiopsis subvermispora (strain B) TaxID=914234 RepID=M2RE52_CERS8|nr:hypothetical protein CERSUDRAFT_115012 [Gelatoporia subvermispora B]